MKMVIYFILGSLIFITSCKKNSNPTSPSEETSTVTYYGKVYHTVKIGNQTWLKENLDVGTMIRGSMRADSMMNNGVIEKYCYDDDTANCRIYGGLYQWNEAMAYSTAPGTQGICPPGWHIPTREEFDTIKVAVNNNSNALKEVGQGNGSENNNGAGTNTSGFSALIGGYRYYDGRYIGLEQVTYFWRSTQNNSTAAYDIYLLYNDSNIYFSNFEKKCGLSIRCLKD